MIRALLAGILTLAMAPWAGVGAVEVTVPGAVDADGVTPLATRVRVRLVRLENGRAVPVQALRTTDGKPVLTARVEDIAVADDPATELVDESDPVVLDLVSQAELARVVPEPLYYEITVKASGIAESYRIQVPNDAGPYTMAELVGATVAAGSLTAGHSVPSYSISNAGEFLGVSESGALDWRAAGNGVGMVAAPGTPTADCDAGQRAWDGTYLYSCVAEDTWVRAVAERDW